MIKIQVLTFFSDQERKKKKKPYLHNIANTLQRAVVLSKFYVAVSCSYIWALVQCFQNI
jgi:hypothetical protein